MLKGDLVSCRFQYGDEAMVKRGKAILKQTGAGIFVYSVLGLLGAFDSYYRGADMGFAACIAVCVIAFIILGAIVSFIRKEYDYRKYNAHICLVVSLGLTIQIMVQGNLPPEKSTAICIISYVISIILGILGALLTTGKIVIKNKNVRSTLKIIETMSLFLLTCLCVVGRRFFGRRGAVLFNALGKQKSSVFFWCCIMIATMLFAFMSAFVRVDIIVRPDFYKSRNENSN